MRTIENFIIGLDGQQKAIISFLHFLLTNKYDLIGKISYNIPLYLIKSPICYLNPIKGDGVELAFVKGYLLSNEQGLLNQKNRKHVAGLDLYQINQLPEIQINQIIQEALIIEDLR